MLTEAIPPQAPLPAPAAKLQGAGDVPRIDSASLIGPRGEVLIVHHEQVYRLRITSQGKLILTK